MTNKPIAVVTGGAGFIGSHMVDLLLHKGFRVRVIDSLVSGSLDNLSQARTNSDLQLDQREVQSIPPGDAIFEDAKLVFHFAGIAHILPSFDQPLDYMTSNVMGTLQVLECARQAKVERFLYAASASCYDQTIKTATPETSAIRCESPYALSKYLGEQTTLFWGQSYSLPVNSMRLFSVFGPRGRIASACGSVLNTFMAQKLNDLPLTIVGDGLQTRDFIFVEDVTRAFFEVACRGPAFEIFNVGSGQTQPIRRLAELVGGEITHIPARANEAECTWADISKIKDTVDWQPKVDFESGVQRTFASLYCDRESHG